MYADLKKNALIYIVELLRKESQYDGSEHF